MNFRFLASAAALALLTAHSAFGAATRPAVFDELQQNVWYLPTSDKMAQLYVTSLGQGPLVVFLHGGPGNDFNYFVDALSPHAGLYKFILFDQRGSLLSPVPEDKVKTLRLSQLVDDLETLRIALKQDKLVLIGHSFGSYLALSYFKQYPDRVAGLVLAAAFPPNGKLADVVKAMRPRQKALQDRDVSAVLRAAGLPVDPMNDTPEQSSIRWRITRYASSDIVHLDRWRQVQGGNIYYNGSVDDAVGDSLPAALDIRATLKAYPIPITVIQGDRDYLDPSANGWRNIQRNAKSVTVDVLPQASHDGWIDAPADFARDLEEGLARTTAH